MLTSFRKFHLLPDQAIEGQAVLLYKHLHTQIGILCILVWFQN